MPVFSGSTVVRLIKSAVQVYYGVSFEQLLDSTKESAPTRARQVVAYLLRQYTPMTLVEIGRVLQRDHTTIIHSLRKVTQELAAGTKTQLVVDLEEMTRLVISPDNVEEHISKKIVENVLTAVADQVTLIRTNTHDQTIVVEAATKAAYLIKGLMSDVQCEAPKTGS